MNTIEVKNVLVGEGLPKICTSITAKTKEGIISEALSLSNYPVDIAEWRADYFDGVFQIEEVIDVLKNLAYILRNIPIIFTFRSSKEGGQKSIHDEAYAELNKEVAASGLVDIIDIEAFKAYELVIDIINSIKNSGVKSITSYHDFTKTPSREGIIYRLRKMQELGGDILKIAVMPKSKLDVLELLEASVIMSEKYADRPIVTVSMSDIGTISRFTGEIFGSAITFGAANKASAPGQLCLKDLQQAINMIHNMIK